LEILVRSQSEHVYLAVYSFGRLSGNKDTNHYTTITKSLTNYL